eukprot:1782281-Pyramimonas_sp.AAC.1
MSYKAAETGVLLEFTVHMLESTGGADKYGEPLLQGGYSLLRYLELVRANTGIMNDDVCSELMVCITLHLRCCELSGIALTPKHHLSVHMTDRRALGVWVRFKLGRFIATR